MPHTIVYNPELRIVESRLIGDMTLGEVDELIAKTAKIAKEKECYLIFTDFREVSQKLSILQIYQLPDRIKNIFTSFGVNISHFKRANVVANDLKEYIFHENVMVNRGQIEKVFTDIDEAKKWLIGKWHRSTKSAGCSHDEYYLLKEKRS